MKPGNKKAGPSTPTLLLTRFLDASHRTFEHGRFDN